MKKLLAISLLVGVVCGVGMTGQAQAGFFGTTMTITGYDLFQFGMSVEEAKQQQATCRPGPVGYPTSIPGILCFKNTQIAIGRSGAMRPVVISAKFINRRLVAVDVEISDTGENWLIDADLYWAVYRSLEGVYSDALVVMDSGTDTILKDRQGNRIIVQVTAGDDANPRKVLVSYAAAAHPAEGF
jgi:hypothetical protein